MELRLLQRRVNAGTTEEFTLILTHRAKEVLFSEGIDYRYGARHLKRAIERLLVYPLSSPTAPKQLRLGDVVVIDVDRPRSLLFSGIVLRSAWPPLLWNPQGGLERRLAVWRPDVIRRGIFAELTRYRRMRAIQQRK